MEDLILTDTLDEFLNDNFNPTKYKIIKECLDYANILSFTDLGKHISVEKLNEALDEILCELETVGKTDTVDLIETMLINTLILWLARIGIMIDKDTLLEKGSAFSRLRDIYLTLINIIEPDLATAKFILQCIEGDFIDDVERLSVIISEGIPNSYPEQYHEFISDVETRVFDILKTVSDLTTLKNNDDIDNNLTHIINILINIDKRFINTYIVREVLNFEHGSDSVIKNMQSVLSYIINNNIPLEDIPYELLTAILLSTNYNKINGALEFINEVNLESLLKILDQNSIDKVRETTKELLNKIK